MRSLPALAGTLIAVLLLSASASSGAQAISATLTDSFQTANTCNPCGPFGTVTVTSVTSNEVQVTLALAAGDLFAFGGAGKPLLFDIAGNPPITSFQMVTTPTNAQASWFSFTQAPPVIMADGTGSWNDAIACASCATGVSGNISGTLSFYLTSSSAISPASFVANANGLYFASDIGVPGASGTTFTGDVAATSVSVVPEASTWALMAAGLGVAGFYARRRRRLQY